MVYIKTRQEYKDKYIPNTTNTKCAMQIASVIDEIFNDMEVNNATK
jgi:hypothetical protein